jgi:hypothetical protein
MEGRDSAPSSDPWLGKVRRHIIPICDTCVADADVDGGAVALVSSEGVRAVVYATDDASTRLETLQVDLAEGPCVDAGTGSAPVLVGDLQDPSEGVVDRWPFFLPQADALGIRGVFAFPVRIGSVVLGTFELYRLRAGRILGPQLSSALRAAEDMGAAIVDLGRPAEGSSTDGALLGAGFLGRSAASVHQAAGMVMVQSDCTIDEAMARLRANAFAEGVSLVTLSAEVISGRRRFSKEQP